MGWQFNSGPRHPNSRCDRSLSWQARLFRYLRPLDSISAHPELFSKLGRNRRRFNYSVFHLRYAGGCGYLRPAQYPYGRGDRKGAFQLASFTFSAALFLWVLWSHFVLDFSSEFQMFASALAFSLLDTALVWLVVRYPSDYRLADAIGT